MFEELALTSFAPAMRYTNGQLKTQSDLVSKNQLLIQIIDSISQMVIILNEHRQIVFANKNYLEFCNTNSITPILGKRPGESIGCINALFTTSGCGTSKFCKTCGTVNAILISQTGIKSTKDCIIRTNKNESHELRVTATPFKMHDEKLTIFSILDISAEKRKESLERVFLHDIMNSAGGISGLSTILKEISDPKEVTEIAQIIETAAGNLMDEIKIQRELLSAEREELEPKFEPVSSLHILNNLQNIYSKHKLNQGKKIYIHQDSDNTSLKTDAVLLKRVLGNMIKNAIEADNNNDTISLKSTSTKYCVRFSVHNKSFIPHESQLQLFQRTFSTKGLGRGLGTYSMKLLGEKYLKGNVWFDSSEDAGTTFFIELKKEN
jgi:K+-sensing histidine kinase KdpD